MTIRRQTIEQGMRIVGRGYDMTLIIKAIYGTKEEPKVLFKVTSEPGYKDPGRKGFEVSRYASKESQSLFNVVDGVQVAVISGWELDIFGGNKVMHRRVPILYRAEQDYKFYRQGPIPQNYLVLGP